MEPDKAYKTFSVRVVTPDGTMFVHVMEDEHGVPQWVTINIGKAGTNLSAWADACARLVSRLLPNTSTAIEELTGITSSKFRQMATGELIRSGPEGIAYALLKYRGAKYKEEADRMKKNRRDSGAASVGE